MFGIPTEQIIPVANFIGLGILGILAYFAQRWGKTQPTPAEKQIEVAGALVDSTAVRQLAAALEAHTMEAIAQRLDAEKGRQASYRLIEVGARLVDEISEMRREIGDLAKEVARRR